MKALTVIPFDFNEHTIRTILDERSEPWFVAMDISAVLDYSDAEIMTRRLDDDEKQNRQIDGFGPRGVIVINESGLYTVILRSTKESARPFRRWVTHEVLPSIRKTGQYNLLINTFLRSEPTDWERRFPPEYYQALCGLFGWVYTNHTALPDVIGQITRRWVYGVCLPIEVIEEMDARRGNQKLHQWVNADAGKRLFGQIDAVTLTAKQSIDYKDFDARCKFLWGKKGHQLSFLFPLATPLVRHH